MNQINLIGRVGKAPEVKTLESGKVAKFSLAVSEKVRKGDERIEETEWFNVCVFGKTAEVVERFVAKGDKVFISGKYKTREYEKDGEKKRFSEVLVAQLELLGERRDTGNQAEAAKSDEIPAPVVHAQPDDDLPF